MFALIESQYGTFATFTDRQEALDYLRENDLEDDMSISLEELPFAIWDETAQMLVPENDNCPALFKTESEAEEYASGYDDLKVIRV